jgi:hypothetical protein
MVVQGVLGLTSAVAPNLRIVTLEFTDLDSCHKLV